MGIGQDLKTAREKAKIPLEAIHQKTKISLAYLEAIERDEWDVFPSHTFARGFLRAYAQMVKVDPVMATRQFNEEVEPKSVTIEPSRVEIFPETNWSFARKPKESAPVSEAQPPPQDLALEFDEGSEVDERRTVARTLFTKRGGRAPAPFLRAWGNLALNALGFLALAALVYFGGRAAYHGLKRPHPPAVQVEAGEPPAGKPSPAPTPPKAAAHAQPTTTPTGVSAAATRPRESVATFGTVPKDKYHHLVLKGLEASWVLVTMDGQSSSELMLDPGETKTYKAVQGFTLKVGNAAGVDAQLDGTSCGVLGGAGKVVELNLPKGYVPPAKP